MDIVPSKKPWILMTAEAALGRPERINKLCEQFDVVLVPVEYFQQAWDLLRLKLEDSDGKQNEVLRDAGSSDGND